jgi:hypothetical protein
MTIITINVLVIVTQLQKIHHFAHYKKILNWTRLLNEIGF